MLALLGSAPQIRDGVRLALGSCLVCLVAACDAPESPPEPVVGTLVLGTGETAFESLRPGQEVPLVAGSQGGYHFWLSFEVEGLEGPRATMTLNILPEGPAAPAKSTVSVTIVDIDGEPGRSDYVGWPARVLEPWCAVDRPVQVQVELEDRAGNTASASIEVVPTAPSSGFTETCEASSVMDGGA